MIDNTLNDIEFKVGDKVWIRVRDLNLMGRSASSFKKAVVKAITDNLVIVEQDEVEYKFKKNGDYAEDEYGFLSRLYSEHDPEVLNFFHEKEQGKLRKILLDVFYDQARDLPKDGWTKEKVEKVIDLLNQIKEINPGG